MSAGRIRWGSALIAVLAIPAVPTRGATAADQAAPLTLRAAAFEVAPPAVGQGRLRLSARLEPAPTPALSAVTHSLKLDARLISKAASATCAAPGAIFSDGFESP